MAWSGLKVSSHVRSRRRPLSEEAGITVTQIARPVFKPIPFLYTLDAAPVVVPDSVMVEKLEDFVLRLEYQ